MLEEKEQDYRGKTVELEISVRYGDCLRIVCLNLSDSLYALHLMIQKVFEFDDNHLFDFGDMWWFDIKVVEIAEGHLDSPKLVKAVKPAPEHYPDWEC